MGKRGAEKLPLSSVLTVRTTTLVSVLVIETVAFAKTAPLGSVTVPAILPVMFWATIRTGMMLTRQTTNTPFHCIQPPLTYVHFPTCGVTMLPLRELPPR